MKVGRGVTIARRIPSTDTGRMTSPAANFFQPLAKLPFDETADFSRPLAE